MSLSASGPNWNLGLDLQHHMILVEHRIHGRYDPLAECVVERVVDGRGQDPEARGDLTVDGDVEQRPGILLIGGDVGDAGDGLDLVEEERRPSD